MLELKALTPSTFTWRLLMPNAKITAQCPRCANTCFESPAGDNPKRDDTLTCDRCGHRIRYRELVVQIGKQFKKKADQAIGDMVKAFNKKP